MKDATKSDIPNPIVVKYNKDISTRNSITSKSMDVESQSLVKDTTPKKKR